MHLNNKTNRAKCGLVRDEMPSWGRESNWHLVDSWGIYSNDRGGCGNESENRALGTYDYYDI